MLLDCLHRLAFVKLVLFIIMLAACQPTSKPTPYPLPTGQLVSSTTKAVTQPSVSASSTSPFPFATATSMPILHAGVTSISLAWKPTLIAQENGVLWVVSRDSQSVARLDPQTNQFIGQPTKLPEPIYDIAVGEGGIWLTGDTIVMRLDPKTGGIAATLRADQFGDGTPFRLAVGDGLIWLLNLDQRPSAIHKIDPQTNQFAGEPGTVGIEALGITFGAGSIWTADHDSGTISRVHPNTNHILTAIKLMFEPHYIYFNPDDGLIWVSDYHHDRVTRIDPRINQLVGRSLNLPFTPELITSADGKVWVIPSAYQENSVLQKFHGIAEFDAKNIGDAKIISVNGRPMDAVVSAGSLWITTQDPNQIIGLDLEVESP